MLTTEQRAIWQRLARYWLCYFLALQSGGDECLRRHLDAMAVLRRDAERRRELQQRFGRGWRRAMKWRSN